METLIAKLSAYKCLLLTATNRGNIPFIHLVTGDGVENGYW
jgi:hypothetical protein